MTLRRDRVSDVMGHGVLTLGPSIDERRSPTWDTSGCSTKVERVRRQNNPRSQPPEFSISESLTIEPSRPPHVDDAHLEKRRSQGVYSAYHLLPVSHLGFRHPL
ncbi:hypothetical protein CC78DRAFT_577259 [Lojkania enalia]|uniref:Uncharacterized protein n=1 Tax=Lojkania enalia TaxID=147567 RepID=A0A9P4KDN3_9PLEO|nr:hypothetical protein CC78DRAFT_577259 [Didymosphaeria enalia]